MYTSGYDVASQISEDLVNRLLAALYYQGLFYVKQEFDLDASKLPPDLKQLAHLTYKVKLDSPPFVDFVRDQSVSIILNAQVTLYVLGDIEVEVDADLAATVKVTYDDGHDHTLKLDFAQAQITAIRLDDTLALEEHTQKKLDKVITAIIRTDLLHKLGTVKLPMKWFALALPTVSEAVKLTISRVDASIVDGNRFQAGVDLLGHTGGTFGDIQLGPRADYSIAVTETIMQQIVDFWWSYTTVSKSVTREETDSCDTIQTILNDACKVAEVALQVATLGIIDADTTFSNTKVNYGATVTFTEPTIDIAPGELFTLKEPKVSLDLWVHVTSDISTETDVFWGAWNVSSNSVTGATLFSYTKQIDVALKKATGRVYLDDELHLMGRIEELDIEIDLGDDLLDTMTETFVNAYIGFIELLIVDYFPTIPLFPKIIDFDVSTLGCTLEVMPQELTTTDDEVLIRLNADFKELKRLTGPFPGFVGNRHTQEVHRVYCDSVDDISDPNKVGYYVLMDAFRDGFDACGRCLPSRSKR